MRRAVVSGLVEALIRFLFWVLVFEMVDRMVGFKRPAPPKVPHTAPPHSGRLCEASTTRVWTGTGTILTCVREEGHAGPHRSSRGHTYYDTMRPGD